MKKVTRKIIKVDEELCDGCGKCIPACPEQALQVVDTPDGKKARLVKEFYCDGLGACLGVCPTGALTIEERESEPYEEEATIARIKDLAPKMLEVHLKHLREHADELPEHHTHEVGKGIKSCPSAKILHWEKGSNVSDEAAKANSELRQWPVQLHLVPPFAPYFKDADLVIVADCVPFAYANFHQDFLKDKAIAIGCPKLDNADSYTEKIAEILKVATPRSLKVVHMEVPCCFGLVHIVQEAIKRAGVSTPFETVNVSIRGERL